MKKFLFIVLPLIASLMFASCSKQLQVYHSSAVTPGKQGVYYNLPRTVFTIEVVVRKTESIKGPYADYAGKYLGLSNVITSNAITYQIASMAAVTETEPDPGQYYFAILPESVAEKGGLSFSEQSALISAGACDAAPDQQPLIISGAQTLNEYPDIFKYYADINFFEKIDTIIEKVKKDTATIEKIILKRSVVEKSLEQKAADAADFITKVKENRFNLISGYQEVNYDVETFRYMNNELEKLENEYRKLFTGITFTSEEKYTFRYVPSGPAGSDSVVLFRFSELRGILGATAAFGEPVLLKIRSLEHLDAVADAEKSRRSKEPSAKGFYYRIPAFAEVALFTGETQSISGRFPVNQYGLVSFMPAQYHSFLLYSNTGGILKVK